jgi:drug/metabolite transporter (DMT)-like permease
MSAAMPTIHFGPGERWAFVSALAYTAVNVTLRVAAPTIDPALGSLLRALPLTLIAAVVVLGGGAREIRPASPEFLGWGLIGRLVLGAVLSLVLGNILYFLALTNGGLGVTVAGVQSGSVLGGLWIGLLLLRERPLRAQLAGAALIVAGLVAVGVAQTASVAALWWLGLLFALGAGTTYAVSNTLSRYVQRRRPVLFVTLLVGNLGGIVPLAAIVAARAAAGEQIAVDQGAVTAVLAAGLANAVALASLALAVRTAPVATVNSISSASIVFSFVASVLLFHEAGNAAMVAGIGLVTAGIVVAQIRRKAGARAGAAEKGPAATG